MGLVDYLERADYKGIIGSVGFAIGSYIVMNVGDNFLSQNIQEFSHTISPLVSSIIGVARANGINNKASRAVMQGIFGIIGAGNLVTTLNQYNIVSFDNFDDRKSDARILGAFLTPVLTYLKR